MASGGGGTWPKSHSPRKAESKRSFKRDTHNPPPSVHFQDTPVGTAAAATQQAAWLPFGHPMPMQGRGRFQVSTSDKRLASAPGTRLAINIPQAARFTQQRVLHDIGDDEDDRKVILGICAMAKKSNSKPMKEIIQRLVDNFERLQIIVFDEDTILNKAVEDWPVVNGLVSFFSSGFPLEKAIAYKELRKPFVVNDLEMQHILQDRRKVYAMMEENDIPHPRYAVLDRENDPDCKVVQTEDSIEINGTLFTKPFVEKPLSAEDHNIYIYFPVAAGGGSTRLFRKVEDRSSVYLRCCRVRNTGSYLYEDFMPTDGTDVKVYTVGPDYQHAEARKSPALDGKVERDSEGKEIRYPVLLSNREKMIARNVCKVFKQNVCGFDLLRANGQHYVCDVNGFSFVKTSSKYYDDCAKILGTLVMRECCPQLHIPYPLCQAPEDIPVVQTTSGSMMELRTVIAVIRHGDRTPKQKMKMEVKNKKFFELFRKYNGYKTGHLKLKKPNQLQEVLDIVRHLLAEASSKTDHEIEEKKVKLNQLKLVLEMYGHFSGINRKVQLKYQPMGRPKKSSSDDDQSPSRRPDEAPREPSLLLILKWGGELTPAGRIQAENLGKAFRTLYPGGQGQFEGPGLGFLRLHSTFRHDLKIYASDEGRVQMTAAAFTKGLLALEGELTPIVVQMVKSANTNGLLDGESNQSKYQIVVKEKLKAMFNEDRDFTEADHFKLATSNNMSVINAMEFVKNPYRMCLRVQEMIREITARIRCLKVELKSRDPALFNGESWELLMRRWAKLEKDFQQKNGHFDISKIPDIYDCIKYDLQHNQATLQFKRAQELFMCSKALADIVIPQEYGITRSERLHIAQNYCSPLLKKIRSDLLQCVNEPMDDHATRLDSKYSKGVLTPERFVRTRLYFTSESHIHSLLSMLRHGDFLDEDKDEQWKRSMDFMGACAELNYMSQIVIMMFEDPAKAPGSDERFHVELHFSPGAYTSCDEMESEPKGMGFRPKLQRDSTKDTSAASPTLDNTPESQAEAQTPEVAEVFTGLPSVRHCSSVPSTVAKDLQAMVEEELFSHVQDRLPSNSSKSDSMVHRKKKFNFLPRSPDPDTPEWDWSDTDDVDDGDESCRPDKVEKVKTPQVKDEKIDQRENGKVDEKENGNADKKIMETTVQKKNSNAFHIGYSQTSPITQPLGIEIPASKSIPRQLEDKPALLSQRSVPESVERDFSPIPKETVSAPNLSLSLPRYVELMLSVDSKDRDGGFKAKKSEPIEIHSNPPTDSIKLSFDEKLSRSLEDSCSTVASMQGLAKVERCLRKLHLFQSVIAATCQRNYKTIHLPLGNELTIKPLPSFFFYNQIPRGTGMQYGRSSLMGFASSPDFSRLGALFQGEAALEGFSNVPLLHPLETLHNNLTFNQVDEFLHRLTTEKYPVPDMSALNSLARKSALTLASPIKVPDHLPSSSNSSGGPNSPTSATQADLMKTLGMFMGSNCKSCPSDVRQEASNQSPNPTASSESADKCLTNSTDDCLAGLTKSLLSPDQPGNSGTS